MSFSTRLTTLGLVAILAGGTLMGIGITADAVVVPTISLSIHTSATGSCASTTFGPVCSDMAGGDILNVSGANFDVSTLASVLECNTDATQPLSLIHISEPTRPY